VAGSTARMQPMRGAAAAIVGYQEVCRILGRMEW
jgi:hypothetical protein